MQPGHACRDANVREIIGRARSQDANFSQR
jgi:hypothetical protein